MNFSLNLAENLISNMPQDSEIGLGFFYKELLTISFPTQDRKVLKYHLEALRSHPESFKGGTALWSAIPNGIKIFGSPRLGDAIYVITDGYDNASTISINNVEQPIADAGIRLFAFEFQFDIRGTNPEKMSGPERLVHMADDTGGTAVGYPINYVDVFPIPRYPAFVDNFGKPTHFGSLLESQYRQMSSFYQVVFDLPEVVDKPRQWKLELVGLSKGQRDNLVLSYPHMLAPCH